MLFNYIGSSFGVNYISGCLDVAVTLSCLALICYVLYWLGVLLWSFVEDASIAATVHKFFSLPDVEKTPRLFRIPAGEDESLYDRLEDRWGDFYYHRKSELIYKLNDLHVYGKPVLGALLGIIIAVCIGVGIEAILWAPVFSSILLSSVGFVLLLRGVRRLQKKLAIHVADIEAHKEK